MAAQQNTANLTVPNVVLETPTAPTIPANAVPHFKIARKLALNLNKSNHHATYLENCLSRNAAPRGLQARVAPQIPDSDWAFSLKWEQAHQEFGLKLTELLLEYYNTRKAKLNVEIESTKSHLESVCTPEVLTHMEKIISNMEEAQTKTLQERRQRKTDDTRSTNQRSRRQRGSNNPTPSPSSTSLRNN